MKAILYLFILLLNYSCVNTLKEETNIVVNQDVKNLNSIVNIDRFTPEKLSWVYHHLGIENSIIPGPTDYLFEGIFHYSQNKIDELKDYSKPFFIDSNNCDLNFKWMTDYNSIKENCFRYSCEPFQKGSLRNGYFIINDTIVYLTMYTN